ncbi:hypothetical protein M0805_005944 [Coniferiporia weirii]|nr:hypothetical protein M0805_005944 [Coniferiporia weirii]
MPMDIEGFRKAGYQAVDRICDLYYNLDKRSVVAEVKPGYLRKILPDHAPEHGEDFQDIADDYQKHIIPGLTIWQHPSFFAYFPTPATFEAVLGDLYASSTVNPGFNWDCSPACTELESIVMDWAARLFGLDGAFYKKGATGGGVIQTTASDSVLVAAVTARSIYMRDHEDADLSRLIMYTTTQTHSCGKKAALVLGLRVKAIEIHMEDDLSLRGSALRDALNEDKKEGLHPFILIATVGTTNSGAVDNLHEIFEVVQEHPSLWVHMDAAWAGATLSCPEFRQACYLNEINRSAQSVCINFHKWGLVNFDCSALWVRHRDTLTESLDITPDYLRTERGDEGTVIDYRNWHLTLSRRFRSLKLWFVLRSYGVEGFREHIRKGIRLGKRFTSLVNSSAELTLVTTPPFALSVFRMKAPGGTKYKAVSQDDLTQKLYERLDGRLDIAATKTVLNGIFCIRFAVGGALTEERHIDEAFKKIVDEARRVLADRALN